MTHHLFIVFLRRPGQHDPRSDPFWEFGSFGCTGCHQTNLLHPGRQYVKTGDRLAFVQGGPLGCKLLLVTPPITRKTHGSSNVELCWKRTAKPFCYSSERAPVLAQPAAATVALLRLGKAVNNVRRTTAQGKIASRFRSSCQPLDRQTANELIRLFDTARRAATDADIIKHYMEALPWGGSPMSHKERRDEYKRLAKLGNLARCTRRQQRRSGCCR